MPAEEGDERRRIDGSVDDGARSPRPDAVHENPAAVVIRRPAPGRGVDPRPAVVRIGDPPAGAVRSPPGRHRLGHPHGPVRLDDTPAAVAVELVRAVHVWRHVARALRVEKVFRARIVPPVPHVELAVAGVDEVVDRGGAVDEQAPAHPEAQTEHGPTVGRVQQQQLPRAAGGATILAC